MVRHDAIRQDPAASELLAHPHKHPEMLPFIRIKHIPTVHNPANTMIDRWFRKRILPRHDPSLAVIHTHGKETTRKVLGSKLNLIKSLT